MVTLGIQVHREDEEVSSIIGRLESLRQIQKPEKLLPLSMSWEIQMMALSFQAKVRMKEIKRRRSFMFKV